MEPVADRKKRVRKIITKLKKEYHDTRCPLDYETPLDLLIATILAAQCTDERVNVTTPTLFGKYKAPTDYVAEKPATLETLIRSCGTFRRKAAAIRKCCQALLDDHGGEVPADLDALAALPGVGRKTGNVVLGNAFGIPSIMVDTHVMRLSGRLELATPHNVEKKYADKIERELLDVVAPRSRTPFSHVVGAHGRAVCTARKPMCLLCAINALCPYPDKTAS